MKLSFVGNTTMIKSPQICRMVLSDGLESAESAFKNWCDVLLLEAMQRSGWFKAPGEKATALRIDELSPGATLPLVQDLLQIMADAGFLILEEDW